MGLQRLDAFSKIRPEYRLGTTTGGVLTVLSIVIATYLITTEIKEYRHPKTFQHLMIDSKRPVGEDGITISADKQRTLNYTFSIVFPHAPCYLIHFDAIDPLSQLPIPIEKSWLTFKRLRQDDPSFSEFFGYETFYTAPIGRCGKCYDANETKCCNTCQEVFEAYKNQTLKLPKFSDIDQCHEVTQRFETMKGEGCSIAAHIESPYMDSEFHISPGIAWNKGGNHKHSVRPFGLNHSQINMTHTINTLHFGFTDEVMPLDNLTNVQNETKSWRFIYSINLNSDNDYSASQYYIYKPLIRYPGIIFQYAVSPIIAETYTEKRSLLSLLSTILISLSGSLGVCRILDSILYAELKTSQFL